MNFRETLKTMTPAERDVIVKKVDLHEEISGLQSQYYNHAKKIGVEKKDDHEVMRSYNEILDMRLSIDKAQTMDELNDIQKTI
ncbi:hypothetical protein, partial [Treponema sp. R6D11]